MIHEEDIQRDRHGQIASTNTLSPPPTSNDTPSQYTLNQQQKRKVKKMRLRIALEMWKDYCIYKASGSALLEPY